MRVSDEMLVEVLNKGSKSENVVLDYSLAQNAEQIGYASSVAKVLNMILEAASQANASDIHIEPREDFVQVRFKIDGLLQEVNKLPKSCQGAIMARIKLLSNLDIGENRVPQDGRFKTAVGSVKFSFLTFIMPTANGEKALLRQSRDAKPKALKELGYNLKNAKLINKTAEHLQGLVLITGPAGSGKTTTLYSLLNNISKPTINTSSIEDHITQQITGVNQMQANPKIGLCLSTGLRTAINQDSNVIMVDEARGCKTIDLVIEAALSGRLVMAAMHAKSSSAAIRHLLDMGEAPFLLANNLKVVAAQRLVRILCDKCKKSYKPSIKQVEQIIDRFCVEIADKKIKLWQASKSGCKTCNSTGYKGRTAITEVLEVSPAIQRLIMANAAGQTIHDEALEQGMVSLKIDGLQKALDGQTSVEELARVIY